MDSKALIGWIRPDGSWLKCEWGYHLDAAEAVGESFPDENGWIHVNFRNVGYGGRAIQPVSRMTQKQIDTLTQMCLHVGQLLPLWIADVTIG